MTGVKSPAASCSAMMSSCPLPKSVKSTVSCSVAAMDATSSASSCFEKTVSNGIPARSSAEDATADVLLALEQEPVDVRREEHGVGLAQAVGARHRAVVKFGNGTCHYSGLGRFRV